MNKKTEPRVERDQMGELQLPAGAYWGIKTARVRESFAQGFARPNVKLVDAVLTIKKACALANVDVGRLNGQTGRIIGQVADEALGGQWRDQFLVDPYWAGAGGALIDNVSEVLANRASEILGGGPGSHELVDPDRDVNLGQAVNDVFPSAMRLAILGALKELEGAVLDLERLLRRKSLEFDRIMKVGRSNLKDAAPMSLGQEFNAYGSSIERSSRRIREASHNLLELNLGATAVGTGINTDPAFITRVIERLSTATGFKLRAGEDYFRLTSSMADFVEFSSSLRELSIELIKIAGDLRLLSAGPSAALGEINLPPVRFEPSATLPDVLPGHPESTIAECVSMAAMQVVGNDTAVMLAAQSGQLETNAMMPLIIHNILSSMDLLKNVVTAFNQRCLMGITGNPARCRELLEASGVTAAALLSLVGAERLSALVSESLSTGKSVRQIAIEKDALPAEILDRAVQQRSLTLPGVVPDTTGDTTPPDPQ